jgi:hypothetical protein
LHRSGALARIEQLSQENDQLRTQIDHLQVADYDCVALLHLPQAGRILPDGRFMHAIQILMDDTRYYTSYCN